MPDQQHHPFSVSTDDVDISTTTPFALPLAPWALRHQLRDTSKRDWTLIAGLVAACLWACTVGDVGAMTLINAGTDITPAGASDIAASVLNIIVNYIAPLGGLGMLAGAGASFARNRQSGITAGPAAMGVGGTAMIFAPTLTSQLMTSAGAGATLVPGVDGGMLSLSINPVFLASYVMVRYLRRP